MGGLGLGTAALLLVICADITACSVMLYNLGIGIKQVKTFVKIPWGKCTGLITLIAFVGMIWAEPLYDKFLYHPGYFQHELRSYRNDAAG